MKSLSADYNYSVNDKFFRRLCRDDLKLNLSRLNRAHVENELSDEDYQYLVSLLLSNHMACLMENKFDSKIADWNEKLLGQL